jgi:hypothetical protein
MAYKGQTGECPDCNSAVLIPDEAPPLPLGYAMGFFCLSLGLESGILAFALIFIGLITGAFAASSLLFIPGFAALALALGAGAWLGWEYTKRNGAALNDWVTNGDPVIDLIGRTNAEVIPGYKASDKKPPAPPYQFRPGEWGLRAGFIAGIIGLLGGTGLGLADAVQIQGGAEEFERLKSVAIGAFFGVLLAGLLGYVCGFVAGAIADLGGRLNAGK